MQAPESNPNFQLYIQEQMLDALLVIPDEVLVKIIDNELIKLFKVYVSMIGNLDTSELEIEFELAGNYSNVKLLVRKTYRKLKNHFNDITLGDEELTTFSLLQVNFKNLTLPSDKSPDQLNYQDLIIVQDIKVGNEVFSIGLFRTNSIPYQYQLRFCVT